MADTKKQHSEEVLNKIRARIVKMLTLAKDGGASEGEVENATRMARQLMNEYNIDASELQEAERGTVKVGDHVGMKKTVFEDWEKQLTLVCEFVCDVKPYTSTLAAGQEVHFVGLPTDVAIARELYSTLLITVKTMAKQRCGAGWTRSHRSYCLGFVDSLVRKAQAERDKSDSSTPAGAIVLRKDVLVKKYVEENLKFHYERAADIHDRDAFMRGQADGRNADIGVNNRIGGRA